MNTSQTTIAIYERVLLIVIGAARHKFTPVGNVLTTIGLLRSASKDLVAAVDNEYQQSIVVISKLFNDALLISEVTNTVRQRPSSIFNPMSVSKEPGCRLWRLSYTRWIRATKLL